MKWVLLIIVFDISNGGMKPLKQDTKVFRSEAACNAAGKNMETTVEYPGDDVRSLSICLPASIFND